MGFNNLTPILIVPDVEETVKWYQDIGFILLATNRKWEPYEEVTWAGLRFESCELMLNGGGHDVNGEGRDVSIYIHTDNVRGVFEQMRDHVKVTQGLHKTFYGMEEFIIEDLNSFMVTFGQPIESMVRQEAF